MKIKYNQTIYFFLLGGIGCILFLVMIINITPYKMLIENLLQPVFSAGLGIFVTLTAKLSQGLYWILGTIAYGVIQILVLLPKIVKRDTRLMKKLLSNAAENSKYQIRRGDSRTVRNIKHALNNTAVWALGHIELVRTIVYVIDAIICYIAYPFVTTGNPLDIIQIFYLGRWEDIDYGNVIKFFLTVKGVEVLLDWGLAVNDLLKASRSICKS